MEQETIQALESSCYSGMDLSDPEVWYKIAKDWEQSGLSQRNFCLTHGLSKNSLSYWRGKLIARAKARRSQPLFQTVSVQSLMGADLPLDTQPSVTDTACSLRYQTQAGGCLTIPLSASHADLQRVFSVLGLVSHA